MKTEKLMKPIRFICQMAKEMSIPDKIILIVVTAFLAAVAEILTGTFRLETFLLGLIVFALFLFWSNIRKIIKSVPKTPEGTAGLGFFIGMAGIVILLLIMILNR